MPRVEDDELARGASRCEALDDGEWDDLIVAPGNPKAVRDPSDLARPDVTLVNREEGSGSRALLDALSARARLHPELSPGGNAESPFPGTAPPPTT